MLQSLSEIHVERAQYHEKLREQNKGTETLARRSEPASISSYVGSPFDGRASVYHAFTLALKIDYPETKETGSSICSEQTGSLHLSNPRTSEFWKIGLFKFPPRSQEADRKNFLPY